MVDARHKAQTIAEGLHSPISFEYANEAARLAAGPFESYDKNKFALQLDTNQIYVLTDTSPIVWGSVSNPGIFGDLDMDGYDIIDVGTVDGVDVSTHAGRHEAGGGDAIEIADLGTAEVNVLLVLQPDGAGGVVWSVPPGGDVVGPAGATDNAVALFDAGTGKVLKNSLVTIDGVGNISTPGLVDGYALGAEFYDINAQLDILGGILGGDLFGTLPNPIVVDLSITGEEQGSVLYFNGTNWVQLPPGEDGYALITHDTGANPTWGEVASSSPITSVFGRVGDVIASIDDYSASQIDNNSTVSGEQVSDALEYLDGYVASVADDVADIITMAVSGDLSGNLPNPSVVDLSITGEEQGSVLYYNGANWVQLPPGEDGYVLVTHDTGENPTWGEVAGTAPVTSVFGRIGDVIAVVDDYSASQIDNDSYVPGGQVSDALEYLDGYVDHATRHENGGADEIEISNLSTSEVNTLLVLQPDGVGGVVWSVAGGGGDVVGPAGATDNAVALFDAGTGKVIKNSLVTIDGFGNISTPGTVDGYALGSEFYDINAQLDILGGILGGDLSGTLPNPSVVDLTITGEEQGSVLYYDGANWVQLPPGFDGYVLITHNTGANPTWGEVATTAPVTSVFTRVGDVVAAVDDYSASQIDNDSTVTGEQVSDALEYLDGYVNHGERHEYDGADPVDGYQIGLVYSPVNYNPPGIDIIGEHIANIDSALGEIVDSGYVVGPAIATDTAIVRFDGITGELVQNSGVLVDNSDRISGAESLAIGDKPAQTGAIRLTNNEGIYWAGTGVTEFPGDRAYKLQIDIQQSLVTGDPVNDLWVRITHQSLPDAMLTSGGAYAPQAGGGDIGASLDEFGLTRIPLYVRRCDLDPNPANSRVQIWVRRQDVSDTVDTPIWLWWGDVAATPPAVDAPYGRNDVFGGITGTGAPPDGWGVWLFDEDPAGLSPQYKDHTGGGHDAAVGGTVTRVDSMDVRGAQVVAGAGWISSAYTWAPGTNDFSILWAGVLGTGGRNWMEGGGDHDRFVPSTTGPCTATMDGEIFSGDTAPTTASCIGFVRDGDNAEIHVNANTSNDTGWSATDVSWDSAISLAQRYADAGTVIRTFVAFVDTAVNPYWFRAFDSCIINETSFLVAGSIEEAAPAVLNVRGLLVDPSNNIVLGDENYPLVVNATDSVTFNVDGYSVSIYDGYVDIVNHDIRNIKTATFNEWPTLTPDEDGYVTVDFGSYQKASIDLNDEASVCIVLSNPLGPGSFTIILQQGDSVGSTISDWQVSNAIYGPSGVIGYSTGLGSITLVKLEYNGSDWFVVSTQSMEPV